MTTHDEPLPAHLEQIGRQLTSAASARSTSMPHRWRARSLVGLPVAAAVAAAIVLLTSAGPATPPAYALTPHADGTYTLTINDVATAVPQVNAEFAKLGINARAIPVTPNCTATPTGFPLMGPDPKLSMGESITIGNAYIPAGYTAVVAAEQTPSGIRLTMGTTTAPLPACFNANQAPPVITPGG